MKISIITTAYNEEMNVLPFYESIKKALGEIDYELVFVNDGSTDRTLDEIKKIKDERIKIISEDHRGKAFALYSGLQNAKNEIIATIDADLQDDPSDIIRLLNKLNEGYDFVCGWRYERKDGIVKKISSKIGNLFLRVFFSVYLHDNNCPMKVFKKECVQNVLFFEHLHRFLTVLAKIQGYKVGEEKVKHYPRKYGKSKYGIRNRMFGNFKTILMIRFRRGKVLKSK